MPNIPLKEIRKRIGFQPHAKQIEILRNLKRMNVIAGGKRVGKTLLSAYIALTELMLKKRVAWIVAPSYDLAGRIWDYLELWANLHFSDLVVRRNTMEIEFPATQSIIKLKTADNPQNLKGEGLTMLIGDESPDWSPEIWHSYLKPNVSERFFDGEEWLNPLVFLIGNPQGKNWFYDLYKNPGDGFSMRLPTAIEDENGNVTGSNNPQIITVEELKRIKETTPYFIWKSDWLAEFREDEGSIFKNLNRIKIGELRPFNYRHSYLIGWDPAKHKDFNVITVMDRITHEVVAFSRSNKLDYVFQKERLKSYAREYGNAHVVIDSTGLGEPLYDELVRSGFSVTDYHFTQKTKADLVEKLALQIEHARIKVPASLQELWDELESFGTFDKNGKLKYEAPPGKHDDCVMSLALACWELEGNPINDKQLSFRENRIEEVRKNIRKFQYR